MGALRWRKRMIFYGFRGVELGSKSKLTEMECLHGRCGHGWIQIEPISELPEKKNCGVLFWSRPIHIVMHM